MKDFTPPPRSDGRKRIASVLSQVLALSIVALCAWALWALVRGITGFLGSLDSDVAVAILTATAAGVASVVSLIVSKVHDTRAHIRQELRNKKTPIYEDSGGRARSKHLVDARSRRVGRGARPFRTFSTRSQAPGAPR